LINYLLLSSILLNLINNIACNLLSQFYWLDIAYSFLQWWKQAQDTFTFYFMT